MQIKEPSRKSMCLITEEPAARSIFRAASETNSVKEICKTTLDLQIHNSTFCRHDAVVFPWFNETDSISPNNSIKYLPYR